jgi:hypothetical protein
MKENALTITLLSSMKSTAIALGMVLRVMTEHPKLCFMHPGLPRYIEGDESRKRKFATARTCLVKCLAPFPYTYILRRSTSDQGAQ